MFRFKILFHNIHQILKHVLQGKFCIKWLSKNYVSMEIRGNTYFFVSWENHILQLLTRVSGYRRLPKKCQILSTMHHKQCYNDVPNDETMGHWIDISSWDDETYRIKSYSFFVVLFRSSFSKASKILMRKIASIFHYNVLLIKNIEYNLNEFFYELSSFFY